MLVAARRPSGGRYEAVLRPNQAGRARLCVVAAGGVAVARRRAFDLAYLLPVAVACAYSVAAAPCRRLTLVAARSDQFAHDGRIAVCLGYRHCARRSDWLVTACTRLARSDTRIHSSA